MAGELDCDWHTVNDAVTTYGKALLEADRKRLNKTTAIGLDETSFVQPRVPQPHRLRHHGGGRGEPPDHRHPAHPQTTSTWRGWIDKQPVAWKERIDYGALDMSSTYAAVYSVILPRAAQVVDPFHVVSLANRCARRRPSASPDRAARAQRTTETTPSTGPAGSCSAGEEKLDAAAAERLSSLLELGDPEAEVAIAYRVKERLRDFYGTSDPTEARQMLEELKDHCLQAGHAARDPEARAHHRAWFDKICNYHLARVTNGPTEALNNLIKRIKRIAFGFRNFENYRIRALLYAGKPNWRVLGSIVVR